MVKAPSQVRTIGSKLRMRMLCLYLHLRVGSEGMRQAEESDSSTSGSRTHDICRIYTLGNSAYPGAQSSLN